MGHFWHTYLPKSGVFYTVPIYLSPIFAEIHTYPKIGRPLWTFPNNVPEGRSVCTPQIYWWGCVQPWIVVCHFSHSNNVIMFSYIFSTTYQKIVDLFYSYHISGLDWVSKKMAILYQSGETQILYSINVLGAFHLESNPIMSTVAYF